MTLKLAEAERARQEAERIRLENERIRQQQEAEQNARFQQQLQDWRERRAARRQQEQALFDRYWRDISQARNEGHSYTALVLTENALKVLPRNRVLRQTRKELKTEDKGWHVIAQSPSTQPR